MAGEYSRELSVKVSAGQCRLAELGYRQGGAAGYGLRRVLIDEHGNPRAELSRGEQKNLQTDRVILVPGPEGEQRASMSEIANAAGYCHDAYLAAIGSLVEVLDSRTGPDHGPQRHIGAVAPDEANAHRHGQRVRVR